ncbi:hypothetical protein BRAO375_3700009 [Bradyrhizobium sp. ORS 375]|nr:hypothetical protein BRAO375_3700009 [Bradyrhizobium sp. ORS 375]
MSQKFRNSPGVQWSCMGCDKK